MTSTHACPCGCGRTIAYTQLSCPASWARLQRQAPDLAARVTVTYSARQRASVVNRARAIREHLDAVGDASRWLRDQRKAER